MKNLLFTLTLLISFSSFGQTAEEYYDRAEDKIDAEDFYGAIADFNKVMESCSPGFKYNVYIEIGFCKVELGDNYGAIADFNKAIEINPNDAYVLNYLAYSWLERDYKIDEAIEMLENAYASESDDPYIIDSIGWAYYLVNDYMKELKKIADFAQINWTNAEQEAVTQTNNLNKQHKYGIHRYSLDQFNLTKQEVQTNFDFYYKEFIIK